LADFGLPVVAGVIQGVGILDMPGEYVLDDMQMSDNYMLLCETSKFGGLRYGDNIQVGANFYTVLNPRPIDDGLFCVVALSKAAAPVIGSLLLENGFRLLRESGGRLLLED
jgi:hypothetical protein